MSHATYMFLVTVPKGCDNDEAKDAAESALMNYSADLYGKDIEVFFVEKLRNEKSFPTRDDLKKQIDMDVRLASAVLGV